MKIAALVLTLIISFQISATEISTSLELLERDLSSSINQLEKDTSFYHYLSIQDNSNNRKYFRNFNNRNIFAQRHIQRSISQFWNISNHRTSKANVGLGLYLAIDPFISSPFAQDYSGANFGSVMIELSINKGTNVLSIKKTIEIQPDTFEALKRDNILNTKQITKLFKNNQFSQNTLKYMAKPEYVKFRKLITFIMSKNHVSLIEYNWLSSLELFCNFKRKTSAMLYIGNQNKLSDINNSILIYWSGKLRKMNLSNDEMTSYSINKRLIKLLTKLKSYEKRAKYSKARSAAKKIFPNVSELLSIKEKLYKCK